MAPCGWAIDPAEIDCCEFSGYSDGVKAAALALAEHFMWATTGRRFGVCEVTVRPCQPEPIGPRFRGYPVARTFGESGVHGLAMPYISGGVWRNCGCGSRCCCRPACYVELEGPVATIVEVEVDGAVVDDAVYRVDLTGGIYQLVRTDGTCWPSCQDFDANSGEGVFAVTYGRGRVIPDALEMATAILSCEMAKGLSGDTDCRLSGRLVSITRQGVTLEMDPLSNTEIGELTGIQEIDQVITTLNPSKRKSEPFVYSPDMRTANDRVTVIAPGS